MAHHRRLVAGGRNFRHEQAVIALGRGLVGVGVEGVHGVPQLVRDGERIRQIVVVVQQHIGVHVAQVAGGERAGGLALGGVHVNPAADAGFAHLGQIVLAHGLQAFQHKVKRLVVAQLHVEILDHRRVEVVHVQFIQPHQRLAQRQILIQHRNRGVHFADEVVVDARGDFQRFHAGIAGGGVMAGARLEHVVLHAAVVRCGDGAAETAVGVHDAVERRFAHVAAVRADELGICAFSQLSSRAVGHLHGREGHIHVGQHPEDVVRCLGDLPHHGEQLLLLGRQRVRLLANQVAQERVIIRHCRISGDFRQQRIIQREQLRLKEGHRGGQLYAHLGRTRTKSLRNRVAVVRFAAQERVGENGISLLIQVEILANGLTGILGDFALPRGELLAGRKHIRQSGLPRGIIRVNVRQVPFVLRGDFLTLAELCSHCKTSFCRKKTGVSISFPRVCF